MGSFYHIAIDVQTDHPACGLSARRRLTFPVAVRAFASRLAHHGIPTLWTSFGSTCELFAPLSSSIKERPQAFAEKFHLGHVAPRESEAVFIKHRNDAFKTDDLLESFLKEKGATTLIVTGLHTELCVAATVRSALARDYECRVVTDLLASGAEKDHGGDPSFHQDLLSRTLGTTNASLRFQSSTLAFT